MKKTDISYQEKLNELRLDISHPNSRGINFILLEGDTDIRLFRKLFNLEKCKVENIPGGNIKLEECVDTLVNLYPLVIGIRDADFIKLNSQMYSKKNMFLTDFHDIEMTMLNFDSILNAIIFEYSKITIDKHKDFFNDLIETISQLSILKQLNDAENLELKFSPGFQDLISFTNKTVNIDNYIDRVLQKSPNAVINDKSILKNKIITLKAQNFDCLQFTNGHDILEVFAKYFREVENRKGLNGDMIGAAIRMLFNIDLFEKTTLYTNLLQWQSTNSTQLFKIKASHQHQVVAMAG